MTTTHISLAAKEEGLDFSDDSGSYRLNAYLHKGTWLVELPGRRVGDLMPWYPDQKQREAIIEYLSHLRLFGFIPRRYRVEFGSKE
jgi:hypothetical protein